MRDIRRIDRILGVLGDYWKLVPDWRLGQLIKNIFGNNDIFYLEDEQFIEVVRNYFNQEVGGHNDL